MMVVVAVCGAIAGAGAALVCLPRVGTRARLRLGELFARSRSAAHERATRMHASEQLAQSQPCACSDPWQADECGTRTSDRTANRDDDHHSRT